MAVSGASGPRAESPAHRPSSGADEPAASERSLAQGPGLRTGGLRMKNRSRWPPSTVERSGKATGRARTPYRNSSRLTGHDPRNGLVNPLAHFVGRDRLSGVAAEPAFDIEVGIHVQAGFAKTAIPDRANRRPALFRCLGRPPSRPAPADRPLRKPPGGSRPGCPPELPRRLP